MDRSPRGNDIVTLRFFDFRNSRFFWNSIKVGKRDIVVVLPHVYCLPRKPKSHISQKLGGEPIFHNFFAKVSKRYACAAHFRSNRGEMVINDTFCGKVPFRAIWAPGGAKKRHVIKAFWSPGAGWAHFT